MRLAPAFPFSRTRQLALLGAAWLAAGCAGVSPSPPSAPPAERVSQAAAPPADQPSLFDRLGGLQTLEIVVDETVDQAARDPRTSRSFQNVKLETVKQHMVSLFCHITGGACMYTGRSLRDAHRPLALTPGEFDAFYEILSDTLDKYAKVSDKYELMQLIIATRKDIIVQ